MTKRTPRLAIPTKLVADLAPVSGGIQPSTAGPTFTDGIGHSGGTSRGR